MPIRKEILHPVFLECCQFVTDSFWMNIFEDLAYGKTPYGTYITKNFFCCSYKSKEFSYRIEKKDPLILYTDLYNLLTNNLGILSRKEKLKKQIDFNETESRIKETRQEWANIKKKNIKDLLIETYVIDMKNKYSLTVKQAKYLLSIIFTTLTFKVITNKDIEYSNGKIQNIEGINFKKHKIIVNRNIYNIIPSENGRLSTTLLDNKKVMSDNWNLFVSKHF